MSKGLYDPSDAGSSKPGGQKHNVLCLRTTIQVQDSTAPGNFHPISGLYLLPCLSNALLGLDFMPLSSDTLKDQRVQSSSDCQYFI